MTRDQFFAKSGFGANDLLSHFANWKDAVAATGLGVAYPGEQVPPEELLKDWGALVRKFREIPTINQYKLHGSYARGTFDRNFGPWSGLPEKFREFAQDKAEWADVLALLPPTVISAASPTQPAPSLPSARSTTRHKRLEGRPTYGDPIDFRGLRHAPVNENGVVFLFGMVARELGYLVEAVQIGFPDCEAKRQVEKGKWQRVRIEFEFESRNFVEHGHPADDCDVLVCWKHNWDGAPANLEIVELQSVIQTLGKSDE